MARRWSIQSARLFLLFGACLRAFALQLPAGTEIQIRLTTKVSTQTSKAKDPVEAAVIAPVMVDGQFAIPAGAKLRGSVDEAAQMPGMVASETISGQLDAGLNKLADRASGFAGILATVKNAVLKAPESDITYDAGVDMTIKLTAALDLKGPSGPGPAAKLAPIADEAAVAALVTRSEEHH